jgi:hypothetical protein
MATTLDRQTLIRINVEIAADQSADWPHFAGSTLRGAFGRALREAACVTRQPQCEGCPVRKHCGYGVVFDPLPPAQTLHPSFRNGLPLYVVQPPDIGAARLDTGMRQHFSIIFFPGSQQHLRLLEHVLARTVEYHLDRPGRFKLVGVMSEEFEIPPVVESVMDPAGDDLPCAMALRWRTPFRVQQGGKPIADPRLLDARVFVRALRRRQLQWCQITGQPPTDPSPLIDAAAKCHLDTHNLHWHDMQRRNTMKNEKVPLGGLLGAMYLHGPQWAIRSLQPLLKLTECIHIGKETVMGLGQFSATLPQHA